MKYEIKSRQKIAGKTYAYSYLTDDYKEVETKRGLCLKFKAEGRKSPVYLKAKKESYFEEFETAVYEATTGRRVATYK